MNTFGLVLTCLPAVASLGLGPVGVASGLLGGPVLVGRRGLGAPVVNLASSVLGSVLLPSLLDSVVILSMIGGIVGLLVGGGLVLFLLLLLDVLGSSVEEEIRHDVPLFGSADMALQSLDLSGQEPVGQTDTMSALVVTRNADINVLDWTISITQRNNRDVNITSLSDGLVVDRRVGHNNESGLSEAGLAVIGETTWRESAVHRGGADELGALEGGSLADVLGGDDGHVGGVVDGGDDSGGEEDLLPHLLDVEDVGSAARVSLEHVLVHLVVAVVGAEVHLGGEDLSRVIRLELEGWESARHFVFALFLVFF